MEFSFLELSNVLKAIEQEAEYPDAEDFITDIKKTTEKFPGTSKQLSSVMEELIIECTRIAVRQTKKSITNRILEISGVWRCEPWK